MRDGRLSTDEQILALATKRDIQAAAGLDVCASETAISTSQLSRTSSPNHHDSLTIRDALTIMQIGHGATGHPHILHALARLLGFIVIARPGADGDGCELFQSVAELTGELGDVAQSIRAAMRDGTCSAREARATLDQLDELDAASARLRLTLNAIADGKAREPAI